MKKKLIIFFFLNMTLLFAQTQNAELEKLEFLRDRKIISEEDFEILKNDLLGITNERVGYYDFKINSRVVSKKYKVINENGKYYFPLKRFFEFIGFTNYKENENKIVVYLGNSLTKKEIDIKKDTITDDGELYIDENSFKDIFFSYLDMNKTERKIEVRLAFATPEEIETLLDANQEKLKYENEEQVYLYKSKREWFNLGYAVFDFSQSFTKYSGNKNYDTDWYASVGYQGGLLYGEITLDYDIKNNDLGNISLKYTDVWKYHNLDILANKYGKGRSYTVNFYKSKGFYSDAGEVIITQSVPLGSRVELIYLGQVIEIQNEIEGRVVFKNPLIRTDQTYTLKIYMPDGRIEEKQIRTVNNYNQQKKREIEYNISMNENKEYKRFNIDARAYYGITDNLTVGASYSRTPTEFKNNSVGYLDTLGTDLTYTGNISSLAYTISTGVYVPLKSSLINNFSYNYLMQLNYDKLKMIYQYVGTGESNIKDGQQNLELQYMTNYVTLGYRWMNSAYKEVNRTTEETDITLNFNYSWNSILFNIGASYDIINNKHKNYNASVYYGGWESLTLRLEGTLSDDAKKYETKLSLYSTDYGGIFSFNGDISYSNIEKEKLTLNATLKINDWLNIGNTFDDKGMASHTFGMNRVVDLTNPLRNIDSSNSSRVKIITYVDENNNNIFDTNEEVLPGVVVGLADMTGETGKDGSYMFYNIGNGIEYDLKVIVKKPSFTAGNKKLKVISNFTSTVMAYVPIKPLLTLSGYVEIDKRLRLTTSEKEEFFNNLIIELKDLNGKVIETTIPDNEGIFEMSGLFPNDYYVEVTYVGTKHKLKSMKKQVELYYSKINNKNNITLRVGDSFAIEIPDKRMAKKVAKAEKL